MAPVFASADIAALVAAFPPPTPIQDHPSLVRSWSGKRLLNSTIVLSRFHKLIQSGSGRINIRDLSSLLGIRDTQWLFDSYDGDLYFNLDQSQLLTQAASNNIQVQLRPSISEGFVSLQSFAKQHDISLNSLQTIVRETGDIPHFQQPESILSEVVVSNSGNVQRTKERIKEAVSHAGSHKVNLSKEHPDIPSFVLQALFHDIEKSLDKLGGELQDGTDGLIFVPSSYHAERTEELRQRRVRKIQQSGDALLNNGWCILSRDTDSDQDDVLRDIGSKFLEATPWDGECPVALKLDDGDLALVRESTLTQQLRELRSTLKGVVRAGFPGKESRISESLKSELSKRSSQPELATLLLQSQYREKIESLLNEVLVEDQKARFLDFQQTFQNTITAPLQLYATGIFDEPTLKQHQEDYLLDYFRSDGIPTFVKTMQSDELDTYPKLRSKDVERLAAQSMAAQTFSELQAAVLKFGKKYDIPEPSHAMLISVKHDILQQKVKALQKMTRGSDVLQNVIWILLAQKRDGLFMTSGKDTSRMIRQYSLIGDPETTRKLEQWKDALKRGEDDEQAVREMRQLGQTIVDEILVDVHRMAVDETPH